MEMAPPLTGVKVLDLSWVMVGPMSTRYLADLGAEVIKVESASRVDPVRTLGPFKQGSPGLERSLSYHNLNSGKTCVTVNLREEKGRALLREIVPQVDVVAESFSPGVLDRLGLGYDSLKALNPRLIMVSSCLFGQTGPYAQGAIGVGTTGACFSGANFVLDRPHRPPSGTYGPWTDAVTPRFIAASLLAALHRRARTGEGCYIDIAQAEAGMQFLSPAFFAQATGTEIPIRLENGASPLRCPEGVYPCAGNDRWVAIEASGHVSWARLAAIAGLDDGRFATLIGRLRHRAELDELMGAWTRPQDASAVEQRLQAAGVAAHAVSNARDLHEDEHLQAVGHLRRIEDPVIGEGYIEGPRFRLQRTPTVETTRGPRIGEHNAEILQRYCGLSEDEVVELQNAKVLA
jgi:benzylsuccinate CoA-transferase BbsF subunit